MGSSASTSESSLIQAAIAEEKKSLQPSEIKVSSCPTTIIPQTELPIEPPEEDIEFVSNINIDSSCLMDSFFYLPKIATNTTRVSKTREIMCGILEKTTIVGHQVVFFCYPYFDGNRYALRVFYIELLYDKPTKKNILRVTGPIAHREKYYPKELILIYTSMEQIILLAQGTMKIHGEYQYVVNNCRDYCKNLMESIKKQLYARPSPYEWSDINTFLESQYIDILEKPPPSTDDILPAPYNAISDDIEPIESANAGGISYDFDFERIYLEVSTVRSQVAPPNSESMWDGLFRKIYTRREL